MGRLELKVKECGDGERWSRQDRHGRGTYTKSAVCKVEGWLLCIASYAMELTTKYREQ